jgi:hypothetical protein
MALHASHCGVFLFERVGSEGVFLEAELRRLKSVFGVATGALTAVLAGDKLAPVDVAVAVHALGMRHRFLEIAAQMARVASHVLVVPEQRKGGAGVIEIDAGFGCRELFPAGRRVT